MVLRSLAVIATIVIIPLILWRRGDSVASEPSAKYNRPANVAEWRDIQSKAQSAAEKSLPAIVAVDGPRRGASDAPSVKSHFEDFASGVIIRSDGLVLSQWHVSHQAGIAVWRDPGDMCEVVLQDGRRLKAQLLGSDPVHDLSLLKIVEPGQYSFVELAPEHALALGDWVLKLGHPVGLRTDRGAAVRLGRVIYLGETIEIVTDCLNSPGDSGGPLLDLQGRLVGMINGATHLQSTLLAHPTVRGVEPFDYTGIRTISRTLPAMLEPPTDKPRDSGVDRAAIPAVIARAQKIRAEFYDQAGRQTLPSGLWTQGSDTGAALSPILQKYIASVVEVLHDDRRVAYGTVVADGMVATKASEIPATLRCRVAQGDVRNAKILRSDAAMDLAILEVDTNGLRPVVFAQREIPVGMIVLTPDLAGKLLGLGIVSVARRNREGPFPVKVTPAPPRGEPEFEFPEIVGRKSDEDCFLVTHVGPAVAAADIQVGDLVVEVNARPCAAAPGQTTLVADVRKQAPGDTLTLSLLRNGARIERQLVLNECPYTRCSNTPGPYVSYRWNDFPVVFEHDIPLALDECGGPVVDLDGNVIGITIARVGRHGCAALPVDVVRSFVVGNRKDIEIAGIGVALDVKDGRCLVRTVLPGSSADKLGSPRVGDQILAVAEAEREPVSVRGKPLAEVVQLVRGKNGTTVRLTIIPNGKTEDDVCVVSLVRGSVKILDTIGDGKLLEPDSQVPDFAYVRLDKIGKGRIRDHVGKIVVLDFWASWCAPCLQSLDKSQALLAKHPEWRDRIEFIAVSVDEEQANAVRTSEKRNWINMNIVWAGPDVMKPYHLNSLPSVYLVGPDGRVISADRHLDLESVLGGNP